MDESVEGEQVFLTGGLYIFSRIPDDAFFRKLKSPEYAELVSSPTFQVDTMSESFKQMNALINEAIVEFWVDPKVVIGKSTDDAVGTEDIKAEDKMLYLKWLSVFTPIFVPTFGVEA